MGFDTGIADLTTDFRDESVRAFIASSFKCFLSAIDGNAHDEDFPSSFFNGIGFRSFSSSRCPAVVVSAFS